MYKKNELENYFEDNLSTRLLSVPESAALVGVSEDTISRYQQFGLLKPVIRHGIPFYRETELKSLFLIKTKSKPADKPKTLSSKAPLRQVPTLDQLLSDEEAEELNEDIASEEPPEQKRDLSQSLLPAIRMEDILSENKNLKQKVKTIEDERDWLRKRVEQLEERSGREQMLLLSEKETLREVLNATVIGIEPNQNQELV